MISDLKYFDGALGPIDRAPEDLKQLYATFFEVDVTWLIQAAARRQKWIDQAQSLNLYILQASGTKLDALYRETWHVGLKITSYLRSRSATHVEKSTMNRTDRKLNAESRDVVAPLACAIDVPKGKSYDMLPASDPTSIGVVRPLILPAVRSTWKINRSMCLRSWIACRGC